MEHAAFTASLKWVFSVKKSSNCNNHKKENIKTKTALINSSVKNSDNLFNNPEQKPHKSQMLFKEY